MTFDARQQKIVSVDVTTGPIAGEETTQKAAEDDILKPIGYKEIIYYKCITRHCLYLLKPKTLISRK